jgi:glycosyltransferase involved in cell wall biosynthesis
MELFEHTASLLESALIYFPLFFAVKFIANDSILQGSRRKTRARKRILWFTDTILDLNGVSVTLRNIGWLAHKRGDEIFIVSSVPEKDLDDSLPPNYINLKPLFTFKVPYYPHLTIKIPDFFAMSRTLREYDADEVFLSSPVTVGLCGLLFAKLAGLPSTAIYHTDFTMQALRIIGKETLLVKIVEAVTKWFHLYADRILVPTQEYIDILADRGFPRERMGIFHRGIDTTLFRPIPEARAEFNNRYGLEDGINLLFAGRVSEDKNIDFLIDSARPVMERHPAVRLIIAGDGPYLETLRARHAGNDRIVFIGKLANRMLPLVYSAAHALVFPSETDTFGMVVLEAQACGIPAYVSHIGGPRNIIMDGHTGHVISTERMEPWTDHIERLVSMIESKSPAYDALCRHSREHIMGTYDFDRILDQFIKTDDSDDLAG